MGMSFEQSRDHGPHELLARFTGRYKGTARTWFEPNELTDESDIHGTVRMVASGRFALCEYEGSLQGTPMHGIALWGHDLARGVFTQHWVDNCHNGTGAMVSEGRDFEVPLGFSVLGSYPDGDGGMWGWRTHPAGRHRVCRGAIRAEQAARVGPRYNVWPKW
jgi:hypothetical protein